MKRKYLILLAFLVIPLLYYKFKLIRLHGYFKGHSLSSITILERVQFIQAFKSEFNSLPKSLEETKSTIFAKQIGSYEDYKKDIWDREYRYTRLNSESYKIQSAGEDGKFDTWDDVVYFSNGTWSKFSSNEFWTTFI